MKLKTLVPLVLLLAAGCAGSGARPASNPGAAPATPASPTPAPTAAPNAGFPLSPQEEEELREKKQKVEQLTSLLAERTQEEAKGVSGGGEIVVDPKSGQKQQRIEKSASYRASAGRLYLTILGDKVGVPILSEDESAWYVRAPETRKSKDPLQEEAERAMPTNTLALPKIEAEAVAPARTDEKLVLTEISEGLPTEGMWRENFGMGDLDGDGRPEIVSPPPRLSGRELQIFKWNGASWARPEVTFDDPERIGFEYGVAACADMDGDGKLDIVYGRHGGGPAIAYNKGGFRFLIETRGLPKLMTTRALSIGDLDGDGRPDIVAISDEPEFAQVRRAEGQGDFSARLPRPDGYVPGIDTRAFLQRDGRFQEAHDGLEEACYGYSIGLSAPAPDGGAPFFASSCRYNANPGVLYTYDKANARFHRFPYAVAEQYALHLGTAMGIYKGRAAAFVTYSKSTPEGATPRISGYGISIYHRDGSKWERTRVLKVMLPQPVIAQGIAVGDLNGDGTDDIVFGDDALGRVRVILQRRDGSFEEIAEALEPTYVNHVTAIRLADVDGDGRRDVILSYQPLTGDPTRSGGFRVFRNRD